MAELSWNVAVSFGERTRLAVGFVPTIWPPLGTAKW